MPFRPYEKCEAYGADILSDAELMAVRHSRLRAMLYLRQVTHTIGYQTQSMMRWMSGSMTRPESCKKPSRGLKRQWEPSTDM